MRQTLFEIKFNSEISLGPLGEFPVFGLGLLLALWISIGSVFLYLRHKEYGTYLPSLYGGALWAAVAMAIYYAPIQQKLAGIPIFGYGFMLFLGFTTATLYAAWRAKSQGIPENLVWDFTFWLLISGVGGARLWYVIQYREHYFGPDISLWKLINLPDGGLVLFGGVIGGSAAIVIFCIKNKVPLLKFADIAVTAIFIGLMFGRMGCFLNGCCYGHLSDAPWAVTFPKGSAPFKAQADAELIRKDDERSLPVHPTQVYSSLCALGLALLTACYYPYRHRDGAVLAVGWLAYPVVRFTMELLRNDERGQLGTMFTPAQLFSFVLFSSGLAFVWYVSRQPRLSENSSTPPPVPRSPAPSVSSPTR